MAIAVFDSTTYGSGSVIHFEVTLLSASGAASEGDGNTRPSQGKMFPRGK